MKTAPTIRQHDPQARALIADAFAGTPGRLRLFGAVAVTACLAFGVVGFLLVNNLNNSLGRERAHAAQLVRIQTIRTSLVKADANATNAFLVGGLEPTDARAGYVDGINSAASALAVASHADPTSAVKLASVNQVLATYTGLVESARANNRQGFPIGAAYLRQASKSIRDDALPPLELLVTVERNRVDGSANTVSDAQDGLLVLGVVVIGCLLATQIWLYRRTRRLFNLPLALATVLVFVSAAVAIAATGWARDHDDKARAGPYAQTVALATARIDGLDAKSSESLTLIARGSGQPFEERFKTVAAEAETALDDVENPDARNTFGAYLDQHRAVRAADDGGKYDQAVAMATGRGAANRAFATFETTSRRALNEQSTDLSKDLAHTRGPLLALSLLLLVAGLVGAVVSRRGIAQRLQEYR